MCGNNFYKVFWRVHSSAVSDQNVIYYEIVEKFPNFSGIDLNLKQFSEKDCLVFFLFLMNSLCSAKSDIVFYMFAHDMPVSYSCSYQLK